MTTSTSGGGGGGRSSSSSSGSGGADGNSNGLLLYLSLFGCGVAIGVSASRIRRLLREGEQAPKRRKGGGVGGAMEEEEEREDHRTRRTTTTTSSSSFSSSPSLASCSSKTLYATDDIVREHFTRNVQFFGQLGQETIADAFVVVVGLGGVGSHCASMLLRSGVRKLRVVDFDQVSLSSLNRHAVATREDVGKPKAEVLRTHFTKIFPEAEIEVCNAMCEKKNEEMVLGEWKNERGNVTPSYVVDCIDNCDTKVDLLEACARRKIPVVSSGGAGSKCDPTRLKLCDISNANFDPLMRAIKYNLRKKYGISHGVDCLVSVEKQVRELVTEVELKEGETLRDYQVVPNFRVRTIPVLGTVPAMFGCALASFVLCKLSKTVELSPDEGNDVDTKIVAYQTQLDRLKDREENRGSEKCALDVDINDIAYLMKDVWQRRDARALARSGDDLATTPWKALNNLEFCRWDVTKPSSIDNLVLFERSECDEWEEGGEHAIQRAFLKEPELVQVVAKRLRRVKLEHAIKVANDK